MNLARTLSLVVLSAGFLASASAQTPTISGVNAFWWLGSGITENGGDCSTDQSGPCYYSQALYTANPNGLPGNTISWGTSSNGTGAVSLSCTGSPCTSVIATATAPSTGCTYNDVTITVTVDGNPSAPFPVVIVTPTTTTLRSGFPVDTFWSDGYRSDTSWDVKDSCNNHDLNMDANEKMDSFNNDYIGNNWPRPESVGGYVTASLPLTDFMIICCVHNATPTTQNPLSPPGSEKIFHEPSWEVYIFSRTAGQGVKVREDTQQFYRDHGRHN